MMATEQTKEDKQSKGVRGRWQMRAKAWALTLDRDDPAAEPLCVQLREGIRRQILEGHLLPGDPLMPQREMCRTFKINQVTATKAIGDLVGEGMLRSEHGRGIFVNDLSPRRVAIVSTKRRENLIRGSIYSGMVRETIRILEGEHIVLEWYGRYRPKHGQRFGPMLDRVVAAEVDAYFTVGIQNEEYLAALTETGRPLVSLDAAPATAEFDGVVVDSFRVGYLAARHLLENGHRELLFVGYDRGVHPGDPEARVPEPDSMKAMAGFNYARVEAGLPYESTSEFPCTPVPGSKPQACIQPSCPFLFKITV